MMRRAALATAALTVLASLASTCPLWAGTRGHGPAGRLQIVHEMRLGRSVGSPTEGHLIGGAHLDDAPYLRVVPVYVPGDVRWGLGPLITLIDRAARIVRHQFPEAVMSIGHISRAGGGEIDRHASHESGRDADIGFYVRSQTGKALYAEHFVQFRADGTAPSWPGAYFDDAKNWALVSALVTDPPARVTYIFVASPLRARLLAYAEKLGAPLATRNRAAELMVQPRGSLPHDDHFHVRIGCPAGMTGCIEFPTVSRSRQRRLAHEAHVRVRGNRELPTVAPPHAPAAPEHPALPGPRHAQPEPHEAAPTHEVDEKAPLHDEPSAPPASVGEPFDDAVDDVDGPLSQRGLGDLHRASFVTRLR
jgi:penicillin-insensitive murein endopeptidase